MLNSENISLKNENEKITKEKNELSNLLKEEKKLTEKMKNQNDLLNKENTKIEILSNEIKKLKEELLKKDDIITKTINKLSLEEKSIKNKDEKIQNLTNEIETLKNQYKELLNKYNDQLLNVQNKEKMKEDALKKIDEKYKYLANMPIDELIKIIMEKDKINSESQEENKKLLNENNNLIKRNKELKDYLDKCKNLKQKYENLKKTCEQIMKDNESLKKEKEEYKQKYDKLLETVVNKDKEPKIFKTNLLTIINTSQLNLKKQKIIKPKPVNVIPKNYDYLCLKYEQKVVETFKDKHYDGTLFSESIKFIDQQTDSSSECILLITLEYFYLYNWEYKQCFSIPLILLSMINISKSNNYISLIFQNEKIVIIETFRVLELINFFKLLAAQQRAYKYQINTEEYIYNMESSKKNFIESLYYGKAYFSGMFTKKSEGLFIDRYEERFGVLCEIGLIILESPTGKPKEIINLLFAEIISTNNMKGNTGLIITVGNKVHKLNFETEKIKKEWEKQIEKWKRNNSFLTKYN